MLDRAEVIVIGAGAAGLMAARRLVEAGRRVVVLEGRGRSGGRILTHRAPDLPCPVELGAEFLHADAPISRRLLEEAGVGVVDINPEQWEARDGAIRPARFWRELRAVMKRLDAERTPDRSFAEFLRSDEARALPEEAIVSARAFVEGFHAADLERISERSLGEDPGLDSALEAARVPDGYDRLIDHLAATLPADALRLNHAVERVHWSRGRARIEGDGFSLEAGACVITAPLALLGTAVTGPGAIAFDPPVDAIATAQQCVAPGDVVRVALILDRVPAAVLRGAMPDASGLDKEFFLHTPRETYNAYWPITPATRPVLIAWAGGGRTRAMPRDVAGGALAARAIGCLAAATGLPAGTGIRDFAAHDWRADPFSRGAYSYTLVGADAPQAPVVDETLFFAGEAFAGESIGTVEGALETGERAARALLAVR